MRKSLKQIKDDMGNIGEKLENFMNRTEEMVDEGQLCILSVTFLFPLTGENF